MSESMYKEENNNISYIEHVKKQSKKESPAAPVADTTVVFPRQHG